MDKKSEPLKILLGREDVLWHINYFMLLDFKSFLVEKQTDNLYLITADLPNPELAYKIGENFAKYRASL